MAQQPAEIRAHIKAEGESLKENFEEIENRVKDALDWRVWYKNNTALALGGIAAGGLLLSLLIPKASSIESQFMDLDDVDAGVAPNGRAHTQYAPHSSSRLHTVVDTTMAAVLGVAADKFQDFMSKAIPGFKEHYSEAQRRT